MKIWYYSVVQIWKDKSINHPGRNHTLQYINYHFIAATPPSKGGETILSKISNKYSIGWQLWGWGWVVQVAGLKFQVAGSRLQVSGFRLAGSLITDYPNTNHGDKENIELHRMSLCASVSTLRTLCNCFLKPIPTATDYRLPITEYLFIKHRNHHLRSLATRR